MLIGAFVFFAGTVVGVAFAEKTSVGRKLSKWCLINVFGFTEEELED